MGGLFRLQEGYLDFTGPLIEVAVTILWRNGRAPGADTETGVSVILVLVLFSVFQGPIHVILVIVIATSPRLVPDGSRPRKRRKTVSVWHHCCYRIRAYPLPRGALTQRWQ